MNWLKLHHEVRTDRKLATLDADEFRTWLHLLIFASEQEEHRGVIHGMEYDLLALEVCGGDTDLLRRTLDKLQRLRIVGVASISSNAPNRERNAPVTPHIAFLQFDKRQHIKPSDRPERVRDRVQRYRAAHGNAPDQIGNAPVTPVTPDVTPRNAHRADTETDTESLPPLNPPPRAAPPAPGADAPVSGVPKPNKSGELIDLVRAQDVPIEMQAQDHSALKRSQLTAAQVAEAYCAAFRGEWGGEWLQDNLSVQRVIGRWAGYQASKQSRPPPAARRNGRHDPNDVIASRLRAIRAAKEPPDGNGSGGPMALELRAVSGGHGAAPARLPGPQRE